MRWLQPIRRGILILLFVLLGHRDGQWSLVAQVPDFCTENVECVNLFSEQIEPESIYTTSFTFRNPLLTMNFRTFRNGLVRFYIEPGGQFILSQRFEEPIEPAICRLLVVGVALDGVESETVQYVDIDLGPDPPDEGTSRRVQLYAYCTRNMLPGVESPGNFYPPPPPPPERNVYSNAWFTGSFGRSAISIVERTDDPVPLAIQQGVQRLQDVIRTGECNDVPLLNGATPPIEYDDILTQFYVFSLFDENTYEDAWDRFFRQAQANLYLENYERFYCLFLGPQGMQTYVDQQAMQGGYDLLSPRRDQAPLTVRFRDQSQGHIANQLVSIYRGCEPPIPLDTTEVDPEATLNVAVPEPNPALILIDQFNALPDSYTFSEVGDYMVHYHVFGPPYRYNPESRGSAIQPTVATSGDDTNECFSATSQPVDDNRDPFWKVRLFAGVPLLSPYTIAHFLLLGVPLSVALITSVLVLFLRSDKQVRSGERRVLGGIALLSFLVFILLLWFLRRGLST